MRKDRIAVIQMDSQDDTDKNLEEIGAYTREAAENGAQLVVLPETVDYIGEDFRGNAKEIPGSVAEFFSGLAAECGIYLHGGSITECPKEAGERPGNTTLFYGPDGTLIASYRKLHMFDVELEQGPSYRESDDVEAGDEIVIARTKLADIGFSICYDMRFPELYRLMAQNGAQVLIVSANFTMNTGKDHWEPLLRARAIENTCYVIAAGQIGTKKRFQAYGRSMVIDPWGNVIAKAVDKPGILYAELDLDLITEIRRQIPSLSNVRSDIYTLESNRIRIYQERV